LLNPKESSNYCIHCFLLQHAFVLSLSTFISYGSLVTPKTQTCGYGLREMVW